MLTSVKLVDGDREMILLPRQDQGIRLKKIDAPMPEVREVVEDRTDDDGTRDTTKLFGARACSIELLVTQNVRAFEDELARYLHPRSRPHLVVADDGWDQERRLGLRADQFSAPLTVDLPRHMRGIQVQWKVPEGIWETAESVEQIVDADMPSTTGMSLPTVLPFSFAATQAVGATTLTNLGAVPSHFSARLYGPCTAPRLINETTGEQVAFTEALSLAAGEYVEIHTCDRTAFLLSVPTSSRLTYVDFTTTSWWRLEPGENQIRYAPGDADAGAAAVITYRPAWL